MREPSQFHYAISAGLLAVCLFLLLVFAARPSWAAPQTLDERLAQQDPAQLATLAIENGDAVRGAMVYYNPVNTCITCHEPSNADSSPPSLGPALEIFNRDATPEHVVKSLLHPSETIPDELNDYLKNCKKPVLDYQHPEEFAEAYTEFYTTQVLS